MYWAIRIKQDLSNIWSSIHEKPKQCWVWVEKTRCLWKVCKLTKLIKLVLVSDFFYLSFVLFSSTLCSSEGGFHKWCKWFFCLFSVVCVFKRIWIPLYAHEVCLRWHALSEKSKTLTSSNYHGVEYFFWSCFLLPNMVFAKMVLGIF